MARCIDADKVVDVMKVAYWDENMQSAKDDPCVIDAMIDWAIRQVKDTPTEDVAPVIHAHWIEEEDCTAVTDIPWSMCSACGSYSLKLPYCAFCGAKMDEEDS